METIWFWLVACMLVAYVIFDGFDFGAGSYIFSSRAPTPSAAWCSRPSALCGWQRSVAAGRRRHPLLRFPGALRVQFQRLLSALMMVLWLLILRGVSIEFRNHVESPVWHRSGRRLSPSRARCWPSFLRCGGAGQRGARRAARCVGRNSSCRCGPIGRRVSPPAFWIGTRCWPA